MNSFKHLREVMSLDFTDTSFAGLHPRLQANAEEAMSVLNDMVAGCDAHHISDLGLDGASGPVANAFFAAMDRTGERAAELGYTPTIAYLGPRVDRYEVPSPVAVTLGSETSPAAAVVIVRFHDVSTTGYGDWATATALVAGIHPTLDDAADSVKAIGRAVGVLNAAMTELTRAEAKVNNRYGPSF